MDGNQHSPLIVVNFFCLRETADNAIVDESLSGEEAFSLYAKTSVPKGSEVGGQFLLRGAVEADFIGEGLGNWHIIAIGHYPKRSNFMELLIDSDYQKAFKYRQAAVESQRVFFVDAM